MLVTTPERLDLGRIGNVAKLLVHTENDELGRTTNPRIGQSLDDNLRSDTRRIAHRYADYRLIAYRIVTVLFHYNSNLLQSRR